MFHFCFDKCKLSLSHASCSNCIYPYQTRNYFSDITSGRNSLWLWSQHIVTSRSAYKVCCSSYYSVTIRVPSNLTVLLSDIQPCLYVSAIAFFLHLPLKIFVISELASLLHADPHLPSLSLVV